MRELLRSSLIFFMMIIVSCNSRNRLPRDVLLTVNGEPVYIEELEQQFAQTYPWKDADESGRLSFLWDPSRKEVRERILEHLIERKLLLQEAKKEGVTVSPSELKVEFARIRGGVNDKDFRKLLARYGVDPSAWERRVRENLIIKKFLESKVYAGIRVSDEEVRNYYARHVTKFANREWVRVHMVVFDSLAEAQSFRKRVKSVDDFLKVEIEKNPYAPHEGYVFYRGELSDDIWNILKKLPLKKISRIYNMKNGYYIFLVMERGKGSPGGKEAIYGRIRKMLISRKRKLRYEEFLATLKKKAKIIVNPIYR